MTFLLKDVLGGNCNTKVLVTLQPTETPALAPVLKVAGQLAQIRNFPIINDLMAKVIYDCFRQVLKQIEKINASLEELPLDNPEPSRGFAYEGLTIIIHSFSCTNKQYILQSPLFKTIIYSATV